MGKKFDFNKLERKYFEVTLKDGRTIFVKMPPKSAFEKVANWDGNDAGGESLTVLDGICAEVLSNNTSKQSVSVEFMGDEYDLEEKLAFLSAYMAFVAEVRSDPK